jgi:hypothetical protein
MRAEAVYAPVRFSRGSWEGRHSRAQEPRRRRMLGAQGCVQEIKARAMWWVEPGWRDRMRAGCPPGGAGPGQAHRFSALVQPTGSARWLKCTGRTALPRCSAVSERRHINDRRRRSPIRLLYHWHHRSGLPLPWRLVPAKTTRRLSPTAPPTGGCGRGGAPLGRRSSPHPGW